MGRRVTWSRFGGRRVTRSTSSSLRTASGPVPTRLVAARCRRRSVIIRALGAGDLHVAAEGVGPQDGFSGYAPLSQNSRTRIRPRWGDYGAAAVDGANIWIASEYIAQTCTYAEYQAAPFGTCGGTRASLGNWSTRISKLTQ